MDTEPDFSLRVPRPRSDGRPSPATGTAPKPGGLAQGGARGAARASGRPGAALARTVMSVDLTDPASREHARQTVEHLGSRGVSEARSRLLDQRIRMIALTDSGTSKIADDLARLATRIRRWNPSQGGGQRPGLLGKLLAPGERHDERLRSSRKDVEDVVASLTASAQALRQSDIALGGFETDIRRESRAILGDIALADEFERELVASLASCQADPAAAEVVRFVRTEVLSPLEQHRQYLETMLAINQQAAISLAILRETNQTLIQNIQRITQVTAHALEIGMTIRSFEAQQRQYREQCKALEGTYRPDEADERDSSAAALEESLSELFRILDENDLWRRTAVVQTRKALDELESLSSKALQEPGDPGSR